MADEVPAEAQKKAGSPLVMMSVLVLLLTLVGAGAGLAVGALLGAPPPAPAAPAVVPAVTGPEAVVKPPPAEKKTAAAHGAATPAGEGGAPPASAIAAVPPAAADVPMTLLPLPPIITNLAAPDGAWVRVEGSLLTRQEPSEKPDVLAEKMSSAVLTYLRTVKLSQIEGASGFLAFRDDLDDLVRVTSAGDAQKFLIKSLVVE